MDAIEAKPKVSLNALAIVASCALISAAMALPAVLGAAQENEAEQLFIDGHKCATCHGVKSAGIEASTASEKMKGPDLSGYTTDDRKALAAYLRREVEKAGTAHKKPYKGTDQELDTMLDWLASQASPSSAR